MYENLRIRHFRAIKLESVLYVNFRTFKEKLNGSIFVLYISFYEQKSLTDKMVYFMDTPVITKMIHSRLGQGHEPRRKDSVASTIRWAEQLKADFR